MTSSTPFLIRLVSSSVAIANRAGVLIRDVLKKGELGIVNKVLEIHALAQEKIIFKLSEINLGLVGFNVT